MALINRILALLILKPIIMKTFEEIRLEVEENPNIYHEGTLDVLNSITDEETQNEIAGEINSREWGWGNDHWSTQLVNNPLNWYNESSVLGPKNSDLIVLVNKGSETMVSQRMIIIEVNSVFAYHRINYADDWYCCFSGKLIRANKRGWTFLTYGLTGLPVDLFLSRSVWEESPEGYGSANCTRLIKSFL